MRSLRFLFLHHFVATNPDTAATTIGLYLIFYCTLQLIVAFGDVVVVAVV